LIEVKKICLAFKLLSGAQLQISHLMERFRMFALAHEACARCEFMHFNLTVKELWAISSEQSTHLPHFSRGHCLAKIVKITAARTSQSNKFDEPMK
jgi:hypothetical protein